jgi:hypothetical protein
LTSDELGRADMLCLSFFGATFNVRAAHVLVNHLQSDHVVSMSAPPQ